MFRYTIPFWEFCGSCTVALEDVEPEQTTTGVVEGLESSWWTKPIRRDALPMDGTDFKVPPLRSSMLVVISAGMSDSLATPFWGGLGRIRDRLSVALSQVALVFILLPLREVAENLLENKIPAFQNVNNQALKMFDKPVRSLPLMIAVIIMAADGSQPTQSFTKRLSVASRHNIVQYRVDSRWEEIKASYEWFANLSKRIWIDE